MESRDVAHQIIEAVAGYAACAVQIDAVESIHNIGVIRNIKIRNNRLTVLLDLHIVSIIGSDRNRRIDDIGDHHHILEDDLIRFLLNGVELFKTLSHLIDLSLNFID